MHLKVDTFIEQVPCTQGLLVHGVSVKIKVTILNISRYTCYYIDTNESHCINVFIVQENHIHPLTFIFCIKS